MDAAGNAYLSGFTKSDQGTGADGGFPDGDGFVAGPVEITWSGGGVLATATEPSFSASANVPSSSPGIYYIKATARDANGTVVGSASRAFQVTDPAPAPSATPQPGATAPPAAGPTPSEQVTSGREGNKRQSAQPRKAAPRPHSKPSVTTRSGARVFAGSVAATSGSEPSAARATATSRGRSDSARKAGSPRSDRGPSVRSATGDLWSGFSPGARSAGLLERSAPPAESGSELIPGLALLGLGLASLAGLGVTAARRRRAAASRTP